MKNIFIYKETLYTKSNHETCEYANKAMTVFALTPRLNIIYNVS